MPAASRLSLFPLVPLAVTALVTLGATAWLAQSATVPVEMQPWVPAGSGPFQAALTVHLLGTALCALLAAFLSPSTGIIARLTLLLLFYALGLSLPIVGPAALVALAWLLRSRPSKIGGAEDRYHIGLPVDAAPAGAPETVLQPLVHCMRTLDKPALGGMILGLKFLTADQRQLPFLRRFGQDDDAQLQFNAQGVLGTAQEDLEERLKNSEAAGARLEAASAALGLAAMLPPADPSVRLLAQTALDHLSAAPPCPEGAALQTRAHLLVGDAPAARLAWGRTAELSRGTLVEPRLEAELLFAEGRWADLSAFLRQRPTDPLLAESARFWA